MSDNAIVVTLAMSLSDAEAKVRDALKEEGFGVLTEIDVEATLRTKLGEEVGPYKILGACNPSLAHKAIGIDREVGLMLPCNVLLRDTGDGGTEVLAADPSAMVTLFGDALSEVAANAREKLARAMARLDS
ncbi:MAG: DUF302 domain-containing protein [Nitriliruptoraceae bacterium]